MSTLWYFVVLISVTFYGLGHVRVCMGDTDHACENRTCLVNVTCVEPPDIPGICVCIQGYLGDSCDDMDECRSGIHDPCHHRGQCINTPGSFSCVCLPGWTGDRCSTNMDPTTAAVCMPGYSGDDCSVTHCGHGYAVNDSTSTTDYECLCDAGWNNTRPIDACNVDIDECQVTPEVCSNTSTCVNTVGSYTCDACRPSPCSNNGTCMRTGIGRHSGYQCRCTDGWSGVQCTHRDNCYKTPCMNGGTCVKVGGRTLTYLCACDVGWTGDNCTDQLTSSSSSTSMSTTDMVSTQSTSNMPSDTTTVTIIPTGASTSSTHSSTGTVSSSISTTTARASQTVSNSTLQVMPGSTQRTVTSGHPSINMTTESTTSFNYSQAASSKRGGGTGNTATIVGASVGGSVLVLVCLAVGAYICTRHRKVGDASQTKTEGEKCVSVPPLSESSNQPVATPPVAHNWPITVNINGSSSTAPPHN